MRIFLFLGRQREIFSVYSFLLSWHVVIADVEQHVLDIRSPSFCVILRFVMVSGQCVVGVPWELCVRKVLVARCEKLSWWKRRNSFYRSNTFKRSDEGVQGPRKDRDDHETKAALMGVSGFAMSVLIILWSLIILVRFYIFDSLFYNLFLFCMLVSGQFRWFSKRFWEIRNNLHTGIGFNIASINIMLTEYTECINVLPFVIGTPVPLFWTILTVMLRLVRADFYSQFAEMPNAIYDASFYDGLAYDPVSTTVHPFTKRFSPKSSFFNNTTLIMCLLVAFTGKFTFPMIQTFNFQYFLFLVAQFVFWLYSIIFYCQLKRESKQMAKENVVGCSKHLWKKKVFNTQNL